MKMNRLGGAASPYLQQHQDNPVHWWPWGDTAIAEAQAQNKPILLSIGYAACHWCHVMAHESFEDEGIAALMNELFINIKVDREERPDLDATYQQAIALLGQSGGWPLTVFLTPSLEPFWGGTYFPPRRKWGRPGFDQVLTGIAKTFRSNPDGVKQNTRSLMDGLRKLADPALDERSTPIEVTPTLIDRISRRMVREVDPFQGGLGDAPKFPNPSVFQLLWQSYCLSDDQPYWQAVRVTLNGLANGGIFDHLAGGFARYSVDEFWLVPHFEKMLYDNAQLVDLFATVAATIDHAPDKATVALTVNWLREEMVVPEGGFASSLDADSEGEEGRFYVWDAEEVRAVLHAAGHKTQIEPFLTAYDVTDDGNWEGKTILNRLSNPPDPNGENPFVDCCAALLRRRSGRVRPGWDDKVLADWNGLMIASLARAAFLLDRRDWLDMAQKAYRFITETMCDDTGRLYHSWRRGQLGADGLLEDYTNMMLAAVTLAQTTGELLYTKDAARWLQRLDQNFVAPNGGYFQTAAGTPHIIARQRTLNDNALPAGNGTLIGTLARLTDLTDDPAPRRRAEQILSALGGVAARQPMGAATFLSGARYLISGQQILLVGFDGAIPAIWLDPIRRTGLTNHCLLMVSSPEQLPRTHPATTKAAGSSGPTAFICDGPVCRLPITTPEALEPALSVRA
jgi:uncharacterized protein YyaL (SSP411 family)